MKICQSFIRSRKEREHDNVSKPKGDVMFYHVKGLNGRCTRRIVLVDATEGRIGGGGAIINYYTKVLRERDDI